MAGQPLHALTGHFPDTLSGLLSFS